ncbi:MAG: polysulfide reductase NrfD [Candidatus Methylarchaceae archaeon HK01B]|nr:polysulfide reductase NrfD [Candidatus Methylarchaceae archaeon HK02M1]MCP8318265.1 polysulfide reductase NrfD [Candidatus Methylarchaceae archaeon HK01B]
MTEILPWGWPIAFALFFGGLGGGAFMLTSVTSFLTRDDFRDILKYGAIVGTVSAILAILAFIVDLGAPERALFVYSNPGSMITIGSTILAIIIPLGLVYSTFVPPDLLKGRFPWSGNIRARTAVEVLMFILGAALAAYTGFVLGLVGSSPFWGSPLIEVLFILSGTSTAIMAIGLFMTPLYSATKVERAKKRLIEALHRLDLADGLLIIIELVIVMALVFTATGISEVAGMSADVLISGSLSTIFWGGVVGLGLALPLLILIFLAWRGRTAAYIRLYPPLLAIASISVLVGGLLMRYVIVIAGQIPVF